MSRRLMAWYQHDRAKMLQWNNAHPIGTLVMVTKNNGQKVRTRTRSQATKLSDRTPVVIWLEGIAACYRLDRVQPVEEVRAAQEVCDSPDTHALPG